MPLFRKKPVVIEAIEITPELALRCLTNHEVGPFGLTFSGDYHPGRGEVYRAWVTVQTLEGTMRGNLGDWLIRGVRGEVYPCKPDIFAATYEPAEVPDAR